MGPESLAAILQTSRCRVIGGNDAGNDSHRKVVAALAELFVDDPEVTIYVEPSLAARNTVRPPDVVLIHPEAGVAIFEVKGFSIDQIEAAAAGEFVVRYPNRGKVNPFHQSRSAMFDVKDATHRAAACDSLDVPFKAWVVLPRVSRKQWAGRWGPGAFMPPELLFSDDLHDPSLAVRLGISSRDPGHRGPVRLLPLDQLQCVPRAFGDTAVLYASYADRVARPAAPSDTLGNKIDAASESHRALSDEQERLSRQDWRGGPRVVRGVAGSGKTVVLANNLARRLERTLSAQNDDGLFAATRPPVAPPRLAVVCFNRTLAPFIRRRVEAAYRQRTGGELPADNVRVYHLNGLTFELARRGLWRYRNVNEEKDPAVRATHYLNELQATEKEDPTRVDAARFDAIYVDEGQDFTEAEYKLLVALCRPGPRGEPDFYVFYDDAQNLYGLPRPNWSALGLRVPGGRSAVMTECFRNTRPVVEAAFNVLYGSFAPAGSPRPTLDFADVSHLENKGLVIRQEPGWRVKFAKREGPAPKLWFAANTAAEADLVVDRLRWLIVDQRVRPEDILVLTGKKRRVQELADAILAAAIPRVRRVRTPLGQSDRDELLTARDEVAVTTIKSAKGYDSPVVLLVSADGSRATVEDRAEFYVACTRAAEHLEVFAGRRQGLAVEFESALKMS